MNFMKKYKEKSMEIVKTTYKEIISEIAKEFNSRLFFIKSKLKQTTFLNRTQTLIANEYYNATDVWRYDYLFSYDNDYDLGWTFEIYQNNDKVVIVISLLRKNFNLRQFMIDFRFKMQEKLDFDKTITDLVNEIAR